MRNLNRQKQREYKKELSDIKQASNDEVFKIISVCNIMYGLNYVTGKMQLLFNLKKQNDGKAYIKTENLKNISFNNKVFMENCFIEENNILRNILKIALSRFDLPQEELRRQLSLVKNEKLSFTFIKLVDIHIDLVMDYLYPYIKDIKDDYIARNLKNLLQLIGGIKTIRDALEFVKKEEGWEEYFTKNEISILKRYCTMFLKRQYNYYKYMIGLDDLNTEDIENEIEKNYDMFKTTVKLLNI